MARTISGKSAIPEGDQSSIREIVKHRAKICRDDGRSLRRKLIASAKTSGSRAALVIKPIVPYLSAQRNQKRPEQSDRVAEIAAATRASPIALAAKYKHEGAKTHISPEMIIG
jgi:hypothetical protein